MRGLRCCDKHEPEMRTDRKCLDARRPRLEEEEGGWKKESQGERQHRGGGRVMKEGGKRRGREDRGSSREEGGQKRGVGEERRKEDDGGEKIGGKRRCRAEPRITAVQRVGEWGGVRWCQI